MKVLVTGATGFIGRHIVSALREEGHAVSALVRRTSNAEFLARQGVGLVYGDIIDAASLAAIAQPFDAVVHSAAYVADRNWERLFRTNVTGTENVCALALRLGVGRLVYMSSVAVTSGNPQVPLTDDLPFAASNLYGRSKIEAEKKVLEYRRRGLRVAILRPSMVYGEGEPHLLPFVLFLLRLRLLPVPNRGKSKWHLCYVKTVADAAVAALRERRALEGSFYVADRGVLTAAEVLSALAEGIGARAPVLLPERMTPVLRKMPWLGRRLTLFLKDRVYDTRRLEELGLPAQPDVRQALLKTAQYYRRD